MGAPDIWPLIGVGDVGTYFLVVSFDVDGSGDPITSTLRGGNIEALSKTATGRYALTLGCRDHMLQVLAAHVTVKGTSDGSGTYYNGFAYWDETVAAGTTVEVQTRTEAGTIANPDVNRTVQVLLLCKMSGVNYSY